MLPLPLIVIAVALQAPSARPYSEERQLLDRHMAQLARPLPDAPSPDEDAALLRQLAVEAGLRDCEVGSPTITETGLLGQSRRSLSAASTFPDTDRFFRALQSSPRLVDVEGLVLRSADFGVRMEARLRVYHRAARPAATANLDPARMRDRTRGATREEALKFARDEQQVLEKTIALDELRRRQTSPRMFLAETGASFRDAAAALTFASFDGDTGRFTLRGVVAGMGAADALERRLEGGFFRLREFSRAHKEGCYQFEVVGDSFRAGPQAALPLPVDEPFQPADSFCREDRDPATPGAGSAVLRAAGSDPGGISLRAVDTDLVDILAMLEALSHEPFVVSAEVRSRVSVEFTSVSIEDALKALPVYADRAGSVHLVRPPGGAPGPPSAPEETPPPARLSLRAKRTPSEDILSAIAEAEPLYAALGPSGLPRLSVFARETPVSDLRRAALSALQIEETREDNVRVLRLHERGGSVGPITATTGGRVIFRARDLAVEELALAGIGRTGKELVAFVYSPLGEIVTVRLGDALADGVIAEIDSGGIFIDTSEGPVKISLPAPRPR